MAALDLAHDVIARAMILLRAMAEVEAEYIGARLEQREDGFPAAAGRSQRGYDLGFALPSHVLLLEKGAKA
jgi:hypothetical protein